jgi:hypothetical protein
MKNNMCGCEIAMQALFKTISNVREEKLSKYASKKMQEESRAHRAWGK